MASSGLTVVTFFRLIRIPNLLIIVFAQYFSAIFILGNAVNWQSYLLDKNLFLISLSTVLIAAAGYIINDYFDIKIDYINKPERVIIGREMKRRKAMAFHTLFNFSGIIIGFFVHPYISLINAASATILWWYSSQLKRKPLVGNVIVAWLTAMCLLILVVHYRSHILLMVMYAVLAFGLTLIREIIKDIEDLQGDADFGRKTLPVVWGVRKTKWFLFILSIGFITGLFFIILQLQNPDIHLFFYLFLIPMIIFVVLLLKADTKKDFARLSTICKILMLLGILSMVFF